MSFSPIDTLARTEPVNTPARRGTLIVRYRDGEPECFPGVAFAAANRVFDEVHDAGSFTGSLRVTADGGLGFVINLSEVASLSFRLDDAEDQP
ncbi:hypothetical protein [Paracoccus alkanivorans]|uniref:Uncharacterized protein n=1 Tax=Paracoccus alkanivorans TaxID=2116655 RepID=A0A3M0MIP1_9RHOB|nr:hypothetical protein [Paracoccus alkanivorans]RMC37518.1 hypothetical protein C9E81_01835 [Paracoccus alkanivorans]